MILLGWEIGTGKRVEIPDTGHLAWFGQTQLSGKTTALEAIAFRGELKAVAFITKQGEGGFLTGRMIPPYFSEPTNDEEQPLWRWVKSILEASQQRKMNFEESWIIRACEDPRQAKTLADVHANIKSLLGGEGEYVEKGRGKKKKKEWKYSRKPVTGMNAGIYTSLKAYFDIVMPQLARLPYTKKLVLGPGLNVMNLQEYATETQALVIRSVMEWVYLHEENVRVIVPEAQDFVPQGKNSPVKMACETLVRKAGANRNFMWLDSQDMAAVDKFALRACSIVGIGVQTEMHEIDRSLATIFTPALRPIDIARLKIGEFFVRTSEARVQKCYVQPAWMDSEVHAQAIARGEETVSSARQMFKAFKNARQESVKVVAEEIQEKTDQPVNPPSQQVEIGEDETMWREQYKALEAAHKQLLQLRTNEMDAKKELEAEYRSYRAETEEFSLSHKALIEAHDALAAQVRELTKKKGKTGVTSTEDLAVQAAASMGNGGHGLSLTVPQLEYIYKFVTATARKDPGILELLSSRPELRIKVERQTVQMEDVSIIGRIARLIHEGYFKQPRNGPTVQKELKRRGCDQPTTNLYKPLNRLTEMGFLTLEPDGFQEVPEMKVQVVGA
jgi:hypothetical protein